MFVEPKKTRAPGDVIFHPIKAAEYNVPQVFGGIQLPHMELGTRPKFTTYSCGTCGHSTSGRVLCDLIRSTDGAIVSWCLCSCDQCEPSVLIEKQGEAIKQIPLSKQFHAKQEWPVDLARLYEEAAIAYSAGAFTAASMICRKLLMACACEKGADDGKTFAQYVEYITGTVLSFPIAKPSIDAIRNIGNEANHNVQFVNQSDAERSMKIVTYMLTAIYSLPAA